MVHFIRCDPAGLFHSSSQCMNRFMRVTPFGHPRITGYVLLPAAYRSLSRPSSPCGSTGIRHRPISRLTILSFPHSPRCRTHGRLRQARPPRTRAPLCVSASRTALAARNRLFPSLFLSKIAPPAPATTEARASLNRLSTLDYSWNGIELNYRPPPYQSGALTN